MARLKVPSLQHLARNWDNDPLRVKHRLVKLAQNSPTFNYDPLFGAVQDLLVLRQSYDQIVEGMRRGVKRANVRENFLGVLPLIRDHFDGIAPSFVQAVERRYYPIGRGLMVPFQPPLIYGMGGRIHFPWFSFWRRYPIASEGLSLFVSMVDDVLLQDPDLEDANFQILDFSAPGATQDRELTVINAREVAPISAERRAEMLEIFAEGFRLAESELADTAGLTSGEELQRDADRGDGPGLFDTDQ